MRLPLAAIIVTTALTAMLWSGIPVQAQEKAVSPPKLTEAQEKTVETAFKMGNALLEKKQYVEALVEYKKVLAIVPDAPAVLWNGGMSAFFAKDYTTATTLYKKLREQEPDDGRVLGKLIQTYQASGDKKNRDAARTAMMALRKSGKDTSDLAKQQSYCRDQFKIGNRTVYAYEMFEFKPHMVQGDIEMFAIRYNFLVGNSDDSMEVRVEVGWNEPEKVADGTYNPGGSFYFDAYYPKGPWSRKTMGLFEDEWDYDDVKRHIIAIVEGKVEMTGGTLREPIRTDP
jgi:tetratricopeptide (TPR) repeat protein